MAMALASLHGQGIVHMDVKPDNIMLGDDGLYKLGDFGLACRLSGASANTTFSEGDCRYTFGSFIHQRTTVSHESATEGRKVEP